MKTRILCVTALFCLSAILAVAQNAGLEGTWVTDGVAAVEAAKKSGKSLSGLAEGTKIKFKVDAKKNKVSGSIDQLNSAKEYAIEDGKLTDKTFTFKSVEVVPLGNFGNNNRNVGINASTPVPISWKGELTDPNTVTLTRLSPTGEPIAGSSLVLHRASK
jgi:hypothetical protein